jgi:drug/metabolite transporter (DMT)-like permease
MELLLGDVLALLAGVSRGFSNVVLRRGRIGGASTVKTVFCQVASAAVLLGVCVAATEQSRFSGSTC